ncbi:MAG TPA: hypothetical protein VJS42_20230 [Steroidobacteraceae bacterium]|nr:hypothetical protein [Steroidobacteraceae bacterium]
MRVTFLGQLALRAQPPALIEQLVLIEALMWFTSRFRSREQLAFYRKRIAELCGEVRSVAS